MTETGAGGPEQAARMSCPVVGIGASAGGLDAFTRLLRALPSKVGAAIVVLQHLDPEHESVLPDILSRETAMPVHVATNGTRVERDAVYVMPPNVGMSISDGVLVLEKREKAPARVLPIDVFLSSLADECADMSMGIVLSGTGMDGAHGLAAIREAGGVTLAQDPATAEYDGMPRAAIEAGVVDEALSPEAIAERVVRFGAHHASLERKSAETGEDQVDEESFRKILAIVLKATGLDLTHYRRTTLLRRIRRRMLLENIDTMSQYLDRLQEQPTEVQALYRDVLVNMTEFFRDAEALQALQREVFPELVKRKAAGAVRIWVPGCSKGQEAYSILISLVEFLDSAIQRPEIQMFATDVNERDIEVARAGVYPESSVSRVSPERLARFFTQVPGGYRIDRTIREMCVFAVHDVTKDPPFSKLDLVSFRNVLIYMERPLQARVLQVLHYALEPGGFLMLGTSETIGPATGLFDEVDKKQRLYVRKPGAAKLPAPLKLTSPTLAAPFPATAGNLAFDLFGEVDKIVQEGYQPAGMLLNADLDVLQFRGNMAPFLQPAEGAPEFRLSRLLPPALSPMVEAAVREAGKTKGPAKRHGVLSEPGGSRRRVDVEALPIDSPTGESYYLVLLRERPHEPVRRAAGGGSVAAAAETESDLRRQLDDTREQLESVVSERESANSDLRAVSERFQASNEELRTINEEFQTAQEELQSTNEELTTLNEELRNRNTELGRLNDDLTNVIEGVKIPILILDRALRIRRVTPEVEAVANILPTDEGRPITDFTLKVEIEGLVDKLREVAEGRGPSATQVRSTDGRWFSLRLRPYLTTEGVIDGVVAAFVDIDELKRSEQAAHVARAHAEAVFASVREPLLTLRPDLTVLAANDAFYETFHVDPGQSIGRPIFALGEGQWDLPELRTLLQDTLTGDKEFAELQIERTFPEIGKRVMVLAARRVREEGAEPSTLLAIEDRTAILRRERLTEALNRVSAKLGSTLEFDEILGQVLEEATTALGAEAGAVVFKEEDQWVVKRVHGLPPEMPGRILGDLRALPFARAARSSGPLLLADQAEVTRFLALLGVSMATGSVLVVPLFRRGELVGFISFGFSRQPLVLSPADEDFSRRLGDLISVASENAWLYGTQREIASTLQQALQTVPSRIPGLEIGSLYQSATAEASVGGDFYDVYELEGGRVGLLLGDVSGKGIRAATLTALVKNTTRAFAYEDDSPAIVASKTSAVLLKTTSRSTFVTFVFCILDVASGKLIYCSAGHTQSLIKRADGTVELLRTQSPMAGGFDFDSFEESETSLAPADILVLYSDGVTEARRRGELYGEERLRTLLRDTEGTTAEAIPQMIFNAVKKYANGVLADDVAILAVSRQDVGEG